MRTIKIVLVILTVPFLVATSCTRSLFFEGDYELSQCPATRSEAPHIFHRLTETLDRSQDLPSCRAFSPYEYTKYKPTTGGAVSSVYGYVKLVRGNPCIVQIITPAQCEVRDCKDYPEGYGYKAQERGVELGSALWANQGINVKPGSTKMKLIGDYDALKKWCSTR